MEKNYNICVEESEKESLDSAVTTAFKYVTVAHRGIIEKFA